MLRCIQRSKSPMKKFPNENFKFSLGKLTVTGDLKEYDDPKSLLKKYKSLLKNNSEYPPERIKFEKFNLNFDMMCSIKEILKNKNCNIRCLYFDDCIFAENSFKNDFKIDGKIMNLEFNFCQFFNPCKDLIKALHENLKNLKLLANLSLRLQDCKSLQNLPKFTDLKVKLVLLQTNEKIKEEGLKLLFPGKVQFDISIVKNDQ